MHCIPSAYFLHTFLRIYILEKRERNKSFFFLGECFQLVSLKITFLCDCSSKNVSHLITPIFSIN